jgi:PAS domain S-box-containing protein
MREFIIKILGVKSPIPVELKPRKNFVELKRSTDKLIETVERYERYLRGLPKGVWVVDEHNNTNFVNNTMLQMLGYKYRRDMVGKNLMEFMDTKGVSAANKNIERRKNGIKEVHTFIFIKKDGTTIETVLDTSPIIENEVYKGAIAIVSELSGHTNTD